jgi:molybdate transport system regulatory protein
MFDGQVVGSLRGGAKGGGSALTDLGRLIVASYRQLERAAAVGARREMGVLEARVRRSPPGRANPHMR